MMIMKNQKNFTFFVLVLFWVGITIVVCGTSPLKKRSLVSLNGGENEIPVGQQASDPKPRINKRTFCNAFTGCGKKRSDGSIPTRDMAEYDQQAPILDNSDDFVDDVARDILAEARLWEALQARSSMRRPFRQGFFPRLTRSNDQNEIGNKPQQ